MIDSHAAAPVPALARRWIERAAWVFSALLFGFHIALFAQRLASGQLLDPTAAARWIMGSFLFAVLLGLRRSGVPLLWGRRALVLWVFVFFLHWSAYTPVIDDTHATEVASAVLVALPASGASLVIASVGLLCLFGLLGRRLLSAPAPCLLLVASAPRTVARDGFGLRRWARPPPLR